MHRETLPRAVPCLVSQPAVCWTQHGSEAQGLSLWGLGLWPCLLCGGEGGGEWVPRVLEGLAPATPPAGHSPAPILGRLKKPILLLGVLNS